VSARFARWATALAVLAVAVIAAVVSFAHIESLALANGYSIATARLLPFSVDGLIVASSLSLATGGRAALSRTGLVLGVAATVAANVAFGVRFGVTGAVVNSWPAVSFIIASEILVGMLRTRAAAASETVTQAVAGDVPQGVHEGVPHDVPGPVAEVRQDGVPENAAPAVADTPVTGDTVRTVAARPAPAIRARRRPAPERVFAADIEAGKVPSLRAIKARARVGTDNARMIREQLLVLAGDRTDVPRAA
jgi:Protein of unknown function (DUF2637)